MASEKKTDKISSYSYIATNPETGVVRGDKSNKPRYSSYSTRSHGIRTYFRFGEKGINP